MVINNKCRGLSFLCWSLYSISYTDTPFLILFFSFSIVSALGTLMVILIFSFSIVLTWKSCHLCYLAHDYVINNVWIESICIAIPNMKLLLKCRWGCPICSKLVISCTMSGFSKQNFYHIIYTTLVKCLILLDH